jgi:hypothetical protein
MKAFRALGLALVSGLMLLGWGPSCLVGFIVFPCESDFECFEDEFCDFDGACVPFFIREESENCIANPDCEIGLEQAEPQ